MNTKRSFLLKTVMAFILGGVLVLTFGGRQVYAATLTVVQANGVGVVAIANDGRCSLIEAINNANDTTNGRPHADCLAGNPIGPDTINLPAMAQFTVGQTYDPSGPTGLPPVSTTITIKGNGSTIRRAANAPFFRLFDVSQTGNLSLEEVSLTGGYITVGYGGAIRNTMGTLTITKGEVANSTAPYGGGIANDGGTVVLTQTTVAGNTATAAGGGVFNFDGHLTIGNGHFLSNRSLNGGNGGAVWNVTNSRLVINYSTFSLNEGYEGGAIYNSSNSTAEIARSTLDRNEGVNGGAIHNRADSRLMVALSTLNNNTAAQHGGAIFNDTATTPPDVEIVNSTLSYNNTADGNGGAIYNNQGVISLINDTMTGNTAAYYGGGLYHNPASPSLLIRSIISGNWAAAADEIYSTHNNVLQSEYGLYGHSGATAGEAYWNFMPTAATFDINASAGSGLVPPANDLNKMLDPALKLNGGPTKNHALPFSSVAVDWAPSAACVANPVIGIDQRDYSRNANGSQSTPIGDRECDIGAVERQIGERVISWWRFSILKPAALDYNGAQMQIQPGDILGYNTAEDQWSAFFDASDAGIGKNVTSFGLLADGSVLLAFGANQSIPGLGTVTPWDVVRHNPATGMWQMFVDGSAVGLTTSAEKIDAVSSTADGRLVISTAGATTVANAAGGTLKALDEDLIVFTPTAGSPSGGSWAMFFDGSVIPGLAVEDVTGASIDPESGDIFLLLQNTYTVAGISGSNRELIVIGRGPENSYVVTKALWDASAVGLNGLPDGVEVR